MAIRKALAQGATYCCRPINTSAAAAYPIVKSINLISGPLTYTYSIRNSPSSLTDTINIPWGLNCLLDLGHCICPAKINCKHYYRGASTKQLKRNLLHFNYNYRIYYCPSSIESPSRVYSSVAGCGKVLNSLDDCGPNDILSNVVFPHKK